MITILRTTIVILESMHVHRFPEFKNIINIPMIYLLTVNDQDKKL